MCVYFAFVELVEYGSQSFAAQLCSSHPVVSKEKLCYLTKSTRTWRLDILCQFLKLMWLLYTGELAKHRKYEFTIFTVVGP